MHTSSLSRGSILLAIAIATTSVHAQVTANPNGGFICGTNGVSFCVGDSMSTNIIIHCDSGVGAPANCNDNLAGVEPRGVKDFAPCYQSSSSAGDAACSYAGIVYGQNGSYPVPGYMAPSSASLSSASMPSSSPLRPMNTTTAPVIPYPINNSTKAISPTIITATSSVSFISSTTSLATSASSSTSKTTTSSPSSAPSPKGSGAGMLVVSLAGWVGIVGGSIMAVF